MPHFLQAGPLKVCYSTGFLRYFSLGDTEILHMIYVAIRDRNWLTASIVISDEVIEQQADSFQIHYNWAVDDLGIQLIGRVAIQGNADGTVAVDFYGKALNNFQKNRIGLCILHPLDGVLGQPIEITSPDGKKTNGHFPAYINPNQPFLNIRTLRWKPTSGSTWQLDCSGDVFETEDQRNWTDASFKTYSTPSSLPIPVAVSVGDEYRQRVIFSLSKQDIAGTIGGNEARELAEISRIKNETKPTHPRIGVGQRTDGPPLTLVEAALLKKLNLSHLRADVSFSLPNWQGLLTNAIADAKRLTIPLELAVFFGKEPAIELGKLQHVLQDQSMTVDSIILFDEAMLTTSDSVLQALVPVLRAEWPSVSIGGGTDDNFSVLNGNRFDFELVDFVVYSINPQVHAVDDLTLLENIAGQSETVLSARHLSGGKPIHISPVTLRPRYTTVAGAATERLTAHTDVRQTTDFGADWTRQSLNALANAGVESITYYQSHGPVGLVNGDTVYPLFMFFEEYEIANR